jgi:hypothetical protein
VLTPLVEAQIQTRADADGTTFNSEALLLGGSNRHRSS